MEATTTEAKGTHVCTMSATRVLWEPEEEIAAFLFECEDVSCDRKYTRRAVVLSV